jgi:hypothetical protein
MKSWIPSKKQTLSFLCAILCAAPALAQAPVGIAEFRIDSSTVESALGARQTEVEDSVAIFLAELAERHFGFVDWSPGRSVGSGFALIVRLDEQPSTICAPPTTVRLEGSLGTPIQISNTVSLYHGCEPSLPYTRANLAQFESDLKAAIGAIFDEPVRRTVLTNLLAKVSLVDTLRIDHALRQVLLPVRPQDLKASEQSQLTVQFETAGARGRLRLKLYESLADSILCRVSDYVVPPPLDIAESGEQFWHDSFDEVFPADNMPQIRVFMTNYVPDPFAGQLGVTNGLVTTGP